LERKKEKKNEPIASLHEKSDTPTSGEKKSLYAYLELLSRKIRHPYILNSGKKKRNEPSSLPLQRPDTLGK